MAKENQSDTEVIDDGMTVEERAAFAEMQAADIEQPAAEPIVPAAEPAAGAADGAAADAAVADGAAKPGAAAAEAAEGEEDDGDEADAAAADADGAAAGQPGADGRPRKKGRVSATKYLNEKARGDAIEKELQSERDRNARADERLRIISEALATPKGGPQDQEQDDDPPPDKEKDVFGYIDWQTRQIEKLGKVVQERHAGQQQERQASAADADLRRDYASDVSTFAQAEPNFQDGYRHLMASRVQELSLYFFGKDVANPEVKLTPDEFRRIENTVLDEERGLVAEAIRAKQSPAKRIFALAKARGYNPPAPGAGNGAAAAGAGGQNGAAKPAAAAGNGAGNGKGPSVSDEIARIKNGQEASVSLSAGGSAPGRKLDAKTLADMPQEEFNRMMERMDPDEIRRVIEGQP